VPPTGTQQQLKQMSDQQVMYRIPPHQYLHVLDNNSNVTRTILGPSTFTRQDHEHVVEGPTSMICVPPRHYVTIANPVVWDEAGEVVRDEHGMVKLNYGDFEIRMAGIPFPLYPGEERHSPITKLRVIEKNQALKLRASREFTAEDGTLRNAGDQWLFHGPGTYIPVIEAEELELVNATVIQHSQALRLKAITETTDRAGVHRYAGEEWVFRETGAYMPSIDEEIVQLVRANILTERTALHLNALKTFTDVYGVQRKAGDQWLVTADMAESHLCDVYEEILGEIAVTTLSSRQYSVILDPIVDGVQRLGMMELRKGECSFFLKPGELLRQGIQDVEVLADDEALLLQSNEAFQDSEPGEDGAPTTKKRVPGDRWMVYGPRDYVPPVEVEVVEKRKKIPLDDNEGIYVRNVTTGAVRAVIGQTYMLDPQEELWEKDLPSEVEDIMAKSRNGTRDKTRVVQHSVQHNSACQVYDFKTKQSRVVFGPELVMLQPDEQFSVMVLSGHTPKEPGVIKALNMMLGPDFMTDIVIVESSDHARLRLQLAYNWHFEASDAPDHGAQIFNVRDFVGDACKAIASRVRAAVAGVTFDAFHKGSARIIRKSVFGEYEDGSIRDSLKFPANLLVITNIDIQSVEPVDESTRASLQKSVQLAIQITTQSQEAKAKHDAHREEEEAKGLLERQRLVNEAEAEGEKKHLLELRAESNAVESSGQATAEAKARAKAQQIEGEAQVQQAQLKAEAMKIEVNARLECLRMEQETEANHRRTLDALEIDRAEKLAEIETQKFQDHVASIGPTTLAEMARAGPEMQAKLLSGLGLQGYLVTDGKSPINLMGTAQGLIGGANP